MGENTYMIGDNEINEIQEIREKLITESNYELARRLSDLIATIRSYQWE